MHQLMSLAIIVTDRWPRFTPAKSMDHFGGRCICYDAILHVDTPSCMLIYLTAIRAQ